MFASMCCQRAQPLPGLHTGPCIMTRTGLARPATHAIPTGARVASCKRQALKATICSTNGLRRCTCCIRDVETKDLSLCQPWCSGVTAGRLRQRKVAVYSNQHDRLHSNNISSASASKFAVRPDVRMSVADKWQGSVLAARIVKQTNTQEGLKQLLACCQSQDGPRGVLKLLLGLIGLAWYSVRITASSVTGLLLEALLTRNPRLIHHRHRFVIAWKHGSGSSDWSNNNNTTAAAAAGSSETAAAADESTSLVTPWHSVDTYEDSLSVIEDDAAGDQAGTAADNASSSTDAMHHSQDETDVIDWSDSQGDGWGSKQCGSAAAAAGGGGGGVAGCSPMVSSRTQCRGWGLGTSSSSSLPYAAAASRGVARSRSLVAAAAGRRNGSSSSSSGGDRLKLELLLLSLVEPGLLSRRKPKSDPLNRVVSIDGPSASFSLSSVSDGDDDDVIQAGSPEAIRLLYPQLDATRSWDEYEVIDWSDVPNNGWGSSSSSSGGGSGKVRCLRGSSRSRNSSSIVGAASRGVLQWGSSKCHTVWVASSSSSSSGGGTGMRCMAAAAAAAASDGAGSSVYEGADAADEGLCSTDQPLCDDPAHHHEQDQDQEHHGDHVVDKIKITDQAHGQQQQLEVGKGASGAATSKKSKTGQEKQARPYMNIVNGRWVPPSKSEAEKMMQGYHTMGPDEGV